MKALGRNAVGHTLTDGDRAQMWTSYKSCVQKTAMQIRIELLRENSGINAAPRDAS